MADELPALPVRHMTRWDFYGILFIHFDACQPWEKSRRELESMIRAAGCDEITPVTVMLAFMHENDRIMRNFPGYEIERRALDVWKERCEKRRAAGLEAHEIKPRYVENGADPADPLATCWDPKRRRGYFIRPEAAARQLEANRRAFEERLRQKQPTNDWNF